MLSSQDRQTIASFLHSQPMATISTIDAESKGPQSALIAFAEFEGLNLIFETFSGTRKFTNLQTDPRVALVIGWATDKPHYITVQYEGIARPVSDDMADHYRDIFLAKDTPCTAEFLRHPHVRLFTVKPSWIRYSDYRNETPHIIEMVLSI